MLKICKYHNGCAAGSEFADGISKKLRYSIYKVDRLDKSDNIYKTIVSINFKSN